MITREKMASLIDQTLLKPDATKDDIKRLCQEAINYGFWSVCVNPSYISLAARILRDTQVKVCSVVGFPLGANTPEVKAFEAEKAIRDGANEIDMVINLGALKSGDYELVKRDIRDIVKQGVRAQRDTIVKVIIETGFLSDDEKALACEVVKESGANFVKTSTGFNTRGATVQDVRVIRKLVGPEFGVKASGGIRTYRDAVKLIEAGANRIGTSSGTSIIKGTNP
jgi:deoxyribose-phosphate aldolase